MSFSLQVKEELENVVPGAIHCQLAELAALVTYGCVLKHDSSGTQIELKSENEIIGRKYFTLLKKTFMINACADKILQALKMLDESGEPLFPLEGVNRMLLKQSCCKRACLRGVFLCAGSMSDPKKGYHLEFVCEQEKQAQQIREMIADFELEAKIICRKKHYVVYMKEGAAIVDLLNVMGARLSLMYLENLRVEKEVRNSVNRKVNCEAANITKTVNAASRQIEDILYLQKHYGMEKLPENLREMAEIRLEYPESSLQELGRFLNPPVGKSGVNHRLRKLSELADKIRV